MSATLHRAAVLALWCVASGGADILAQTANEPIVPEGAKLELLFTRQAKISGGLTEGAAVAPDGSIYFSDIPIGKDRGMILRYDPRAEKTTVFTDDSHKSNGLMFDALGRLVSCEGSDGGGRAIARWDVKTKQREVLADRYLGKRFNAPNDLCIDLSGRIYFTDPRYLGDESRELEHRAVYRIDGDGTVTEVTHEVEKPNGIAISPDQRTLYVGDNNNGTDRIDPNAPPPEKGAMKIYAFQLNDGGAVSGPRRVIYDFGHEDGCDGMTVDSRGNLYLSSRAATRPGVLIINPEGKELGFVPTGQPRTDGKPPQGLPSNCDFGIGPEKNVLYVTVDTSLYRVRLNATGWHLPWKQ
jgi:gluconolactonase